MAMREALMIACVPDISRLMSVAVSLISVKDVLEEFPTGPPVLSGSAGAVPESVPEVSQAPACSVALATKRSGAQKSAVASC